MTIPYLPKWKANKTEMEIEIQEERDRDRQVGNRNKCYSAVSERNL